jgi:translation initiation factor IF-2
VAVKFPIPLREFAPEVGLKPFQLISELMRMGTFASMNYVLDEATARKIGERFGFTVEAKLPAAPRASQRATKAKEAIPDVVLEPRPPIVCILGHVDHGKTTLLDTIRRTRVAAGEAGGITQHIGAYEVESSKKKITFIDTPGHAAFSKMRERGANLTDIAVLVVAADDGFMPQSDEALKFAQRAGVPVVVAINKTDAKGANIDRVKQQMQQRGILSEDWGGETLCAPISALNGDGIPHLLELLLVQAEMLALQADYRAPVRGVVVESQVEVGRGSTATVIIQEGTLRTGDVLLCGTHYCKIRALTDDGGKAVKEAPPAKPVKTIGWTGPLEAGAVFSQVADEKVAREKVEENEAALRNREPAAAEPKGYGVRGGEAGLDALFAAINAKQKRVLRVVLRADVQGSVEALQACLGALPQDKIGLEILRAEVGPVSKGDVEFAVPAGATILSFNSKAESGVPALLKQHGVPIIQHSIIYELVDRVRDAMADLLEPELREEKLGAAQVRQVFNLSKGIIAGCMVTEGKINRDAQARLWRDGKQAFEGRIGSLRRGKEEATEVRAGYECGVCIAGFSGYAVGDVIECYTVTKIRPKL